MSENILAGSELLFETTILPRETMGESVLWEVRADLHEPAAAPLSHRLVSQEIHPHGHGHD